jgi:hypothetical protein
MATLEKRVLSVEDLDPELPGVLQLWKEALWKEAITWVAIEHQPRPEGERVEAPN